MLPGNSSCCCEPWITFTVFFSAEGTTLCYILNHSCICCLICLVENYYFSVILSIAPHHLVVRFFLVLKQLELSVWLSWLEEILWVVLAPWEGSFVKLHEIWGMMGQITAFWNTYLSCNPTIYFPHPLISDWNPSRVPLNREKVT